ncbi:MAG TPA: helix-turn-helix transcriptional regulator [Mycobacteriales bacterium]|nr:helix-turn-helix transcriptional regulator [Mycobacteriales bacterium]
MPSRAEPGALGIQPLKQLLVEAGITHEQAAEALGVGANFISLVVNGRSRPSLQNAARLAKLVDRPIEEIFTAQMLGTARWRGRR